MSIISVSLPADGTTADVADYNNPITTIGNVINGGLDNSNIASGAAIATSKLADDAGITYAKVSSGFVVQVASSDIATSSTGTILIPFDDTIPQITEGDQYMTQAITPKASTNRLSIEVVAYASSSVAASIIAALFQDSTANALAVAPQYQATAGGLVNLKITYDMLAGTTSSTTFRVRIGGDTAGTLTFNGNAGSRKWGGALNSNIKITEYKP